MLWAAAYILVGIVVAGFNSGYSGDQPGWDSFFMIVSWPIWIALLLIVSVFAIGALIGERVKLMERGS